MIVMGAVHGVDVHRAFSLQELAVSHRGFLIVDDNVAVIAAQHIDMGRHVDQMATFRHQITQPIACAQRKFREG